MIADSEKSLARVDTFINTARNFAGAKVSVISIMIQLTRLDIRVTFL